LPESSLARAIYQRSSTESEEKMEQGYACDQPQTGLISEKKASQYVPPTQRQKLHQKKNILEAELMRVDAAIAALDAHPDLEEFTKTLEAALR
jgi:galactokinase